MPTPIPSPSFDLVRYAAAQAYADAAPNPTNDAMSRRNLNWRASAPVTRDEAISIMQETCPSYNEFEPNLLKKLPANASVTLAREGSVCIYVDKVGAATAKNMKADEWHAKDGEVRIWWD
jgi:hypothetical protein